MSGRIPLLLLPGLMCTGAVWSDVVDELHGGIRAEPVTHPPLADMADLARDLLRRAPARFAVAGHSFGGYIALAMLRLQPDRISHLILVSSSARDDTEQQRAGRDQMIRAAQAGRYDTIPARMASVLLGPKRRDDAALIQRLANMAATVGPDAFVAHLTAIKARRDSGDLLPGVAVPTLIASGKEDRIVPPLEQEAMALAVPGAALRLFDDCGHMAPVEQPSGLAAAINAHLGF